MIAKLLLGLAFIGLAPAAARATVYDYSFDNVASGTFSTGAASGTDAGFFLLTSLTVGTFVDNFLGAVPIAISVSSFQPGSAYNPTTGAFINHAAGSTFNDIGNMDSPANSSINGNPIHRLYGYSFKLGSGEMAVLDANGNFYSANGTLTISAESPGVPEPASLMLLGAGLAGLGAIRRRR